MNTIQSNQSPNFTAKITYMEDGLRKTVNSEHVQALRQIAGTRLTGMIGILDKDTVVLMGPPGRSDEEVVLKGPGHILDKLAQCLVDKGHVDMRNYKGKGNVTPEGELKNLTKEVFPAPQFNPPETNHTFKVSG